MRVGERPSGGGRAGCDRHWRRLLSVQSTHLTLAIGLGPD